MVKNTNPDIKPDWHIVSLNENISWMKSVQERVEHARGIYAFDRNLATYCCSATANYELHRIGTQLWPPSGISDEEREAINDLETEADASFSPVSYMTISDIERLGEAIVKFEVDPEDDDDAVTQAREAYCTGALDTPGPEVWS